MIVPLRKHTLRNILTITLILSTVSTTLYAQEPNAHPKNIILMIGDGWGFNHMISTDYYQNGETGKQIYQQTFINLAMSTYPAGSSYDPAQIHGDFNVPKRGATDSSAAATAMATGVKTRNGTVGLDPDANRIPNMVETAEAKGKATGVVTTVPLSHATPACFIAHNKKRSEYVEIAKEMFLTSAADVIIGSGNPFYDNDGKPVENPEDDAYRYAGGKETWDALLAGTAGADANGDGTPDPWKLIQTRAEFQDLAKGTTLKRVAGICQVPATLQQRRTGVDGDPADDEPYQTPLNENVPTLPEMATGALNVLKQDPDGFFLMIEGGAIDWAEGKLGRMIEENISFNNAIETVAAWVEANSSWDETLVIVTADHECGYLMGLGSDPESKPVVNNGKGKLPGAVWINKGHTNQLVPFFARGAGANVLKACATSNDPKFGPYLDNTDLGKTMISFFK